MRSNRQQTEIDGGTVRVGERCWFEGDDRQERGTVLEIGTLANTSDPDGLWLRLQTEDGETRTVQDIFCWK